MWWLPFVGFASGYSLARVKKYLWDFGETRVREVKCECECQIVGVDPDFVFPRVSTIKSFGKEGVAPLSEESKMYFAKSLLGSVGNGCNTGVCRVYEKYHPQGRWREPTEFVFGGQKSGENANGEC